MDAQTLNPGSVKCPSCNLRMTQGFVCRTIEGERHAQKEDNQRCIAHRHLEADVTEGCSHREHAHQGMQ
jgi:hypothetical protein